MCHSSTGLSGTLLVFACFATGCNLFTQQNLAPCSGSYTGTFTGAGGGMVSGSLTADGSLSLTFTPTNQTALGLTSFSFQASHVTGDFAGKNADDISASFDLGSCRMSGIWAFHGSSGVWSATIVRP